MKRLAILTAIIAAGLTFLAAGAARAADPVNCALLGGTEFPAITPTECQILGPVTKTGPFTIAETVHIVGPNGKITTGLGGINLTITTGNFVMDDKTLIDGNVNAGNCPGLGGPITITLNSGNVNVKPGAIIRSNSCQGGAINITTAATGTIDIDGTVESVGNESGSGGGAAQKPGGGPIFIKAACALTISDDGVVSSRGKDPGADLVHLEGCVVVVNGLVESTGAGHAIPTNPPTSCNDVTPAAGSVRRNPITRPGKPVNSVGCVEIWSGTTLTIDSTDSHHGEVNADIGTSGGTQGKGWIDLFANGTISIQDDTGNDTTTPAGVPVVVFAVHSNGGLPQGNDDGGLITILSLNGDVVATKNAIQADALSAGSFGGEIHVEAKNNINFNTASIFARGDFVGPGFGTGGLIGTLTAPIRAYTGSLTWTTGDGDTRPTGSSVPLAQRGQINLQACNTLPATGITLGATFPVIGAVVPPYPNQLAPACTGGPVLPAYATPFPAATCINQCVGGGRKTGLKFNDLDNNGKKDPGEPGIPSWPIQLFNNVGTPIGAPIFTNASGVYQFNLAFGTYTVCEVLLPGWTQTFPTAGANCTALGAGLGPLGYTFTLTAGSPVDDGNDFGNHFVVATCDEDPNAVCTAAVDAGGKAHGGLPVFTTVKAAYDAANNGDTICMFTNTTENIVLDDDKTLTITQCKSAKVTAKDKTLPVWTISSTGQLTIIGPDAVSGTIGWRVETDGHTLSAVRATGASAQGILVLGADNHISWNQINKCGVGLRVEGSDNDLRGGTVDHNTGDGVQFGPTATGNLLQGTTVKLNKGNGIVVEGSSNTIFNNPRVDNNSLIGIQVTGNSNTIKGNTVGSGSGKGNGADGVQVTGNGTTLDSNKVSANAGDGFDVSGGTNLSPNVLNGNQSNVGASHGSKENTGAEYRLLDTIQSGGGNKADGKKVPTAAKCSDFPATNATVTFSPNPEVCE